jgi:NitT/TauT family transport system substrate-binding protein
MTRVALAAIAALAAVVALAACGGDESGGGGAGGGSGGGQGQSAAAVPAKPEPGTFRMGIEPWLGYGPWRIAEAKGMFAQQGLGQVTITNFTTDDQINAALASGQLDGSNIATHTALRLAASGLPIKIVLLEDLSTTADAIIARAPVKTIADLRGKRVAFEEGTTSDILLSYALAQNGMSKKDIQVVPIPAADAGAALIAGRVDAAVTYEPYLSSAMRQRRGVEEIYTAGENPGLVGDVFVVRDDVLEKRPGQVGALLRTWNAAVQYYQANRRESQRIITRAVGAEPGSLSTAFAGVELYTLRDNLQQLKGTYANKTILDVEKAARDAGLLEGEIDPKQLIVTRFVEATAK